MGGRVTMGSYEDCPEVVAHPELGEAMQAVGLAMTEAVGEKVEALGKMCEALGLDDEATGGLVCSAVSTMAMNAMSMSLGCAAVSGADASALHHTINLAVIGAIDQALRVERQPAIVELREVLVAASARIQDVLEREGA